MNTAKKILTVLISVLLWVVILVAALFAFTTLATRDENNVSNVAGFTPLSVITESMSPTFNAGDLIFIHTCDPAELEEGDIITFHTIIDNEYALNTHRIQEIQDNGGVRSYVTKGDNNEIADTHIIADGDIVGKYVGHLAKVGRLMDFLSSSMGFLLVIVLPMLLFFVYQVYRLIMVSISLKKAIALETAQEIAAAGGQPQAGTAPPAEPAAAPEKEAKPAPAKEAEPAPEKEETAPAREKDAAPAEETEAAPAEKPAADAAPAEEPEPAAPEEPSASEEKSPVKKPSAEEKAQAALAEAEAALAEARRLKEEAERLKAEAEAKAQGTEEPAAPQTEGENDPS